MNLEAFAIWFKTSIPGIILLGALGSMLAIIFIKLLFPTARVIRALVQFVNHITDRFAHRQVFLNYLFLEECKDNGNLVSVLLLVALRFSRGVLCALGGFYCTKGAIWAYAQTPHSHWLLPLVIATELLFFIVVLDLITVVMAYGYFVIVPMNRLKEKHKSDISFATKVKDIPK